MRSGCVVVEVPEVSWIAWDRGRPRGAGCYQVDFEGVAGDPLSFTLEVPDSLAAVVWAAHAEPSGGGGSVSAVVTAGTPSGGYTPLSVSFPAFRCGRFRWDAQMSPTGDLGVSPVTAVGGVVVAVREVTR